MSPTLSNPNHYMKVKVAINVTHDQRKRYTYDADLIQTKTELSS